MFATFRAGMARRPAPLIPAVRAITPANPSFAASVAAPVAAPAVVG